MIAVQGRYADPLLEAERRQRISEGMSRFWASLSDEERTTRAQKSSATARANGSTGRGRGPQLLIEHGTVSAYFNGQKCRCVECRFAASEYMRARREAAGVPDDD